MRKYCKNNKTFSREETGADILKDCCNIFLHVSYIYIVNVCNWKKIHLHRFSFRPAAAQSCAGWGGMRIINRFIKI
ncbi:MAG: hypothetical protein VR69_06845 [Peptococcaceae bacterium BRH_c4b]|nr:MAG: hypothetical protein VR69_06845 [Peptococcaceae bacterium BRH_c4b]